MIVRVVVFFPNCKESFTRLNHAISFTQSIQNIQSYILQKVISVLYSIALIWLGEKQNPLYILFFTITQSDNVLKRIYNSIIL